jgi:hypothetical protein
MKRAAACLIGLCAVWPGIAVSAEKLFDVSQLAGSIATDLAVDRNDKRMARSLRSVRLTERVSAETIAQLAKTGAGPQTLSALEVLEARSAGLPAPPQEALTAAPAPSASEQQEITGRMRRCVAGYLARFPDFIATKAVRQFHNFDAFGAYDIHQTDQRLVISDDRWYAAFAYTTEGAHAVPQENRCRHTNVHRRVRRHAGGRLRSRSHRPIRMATLASGQQKPAGSVRISDRFRGVGVWRLLPQARPGVYEGTPPASRRRWR